jgi:S1-C subfamily serine protease
MWLLLAHGCYLTVSYHPVSTRILISFLCCGILLLDADKAVSSGQGVELQSAPNRNQEKPSPTPALPSLPFDLPSLVRQVRGAVVLLSVYDRNGKLRGKGTGFFVSSDSIATNAHVIEGAATVRAKAEDGTVYEVPQVYACDPELDIAILKTAKDSGNTVRLQSENNVEVGERIAVIGNPLGTFENTVSEGIISGLRKDKAGDWLQITAAVSHGSSGSPVINASGTVVGIVALGFTEGQSLNFARPSKYLASMPRKNLSLGEIAEQLQQRVLSDGDYKAGLEAQSKSQMVTAIRLFTQALAKFPDNLMILDHLGASHFALAGQRITKRYVVAEASKQQFRETVRIYKKILNIDENNAHALEMIAKAYLWLEQPDDAITYCRLGLKIDALKVELWRIIADAYGDKGELDRAIDAAERAVELNPRDDYCWDSLVSFYHSQGDSRREANARSRRAAARSQSPSVSEKSPTPHRR